MSSNRAKEFGAFCKQQGYELLQWQRDFASRVLSGDTLALPNARKVGKTTLRRLLMQFEESKRISEDTTNAR